MTLESVKEWLWGCTHCGTCKDVLNIFVPACPSGERYQVESYFPSGRMFIARGVSQVQLSLSDEEIRDRIYACTGCLSCEQQCGVYHHQHIFEVVQALRTEAVTQGLLNPGYMSMYYGLRGEDNVFGKPKDERGDWAKGLDIKLATMDKVNVLYHPGCTLSFDQGLWNVPRSMIELLNAGGEDAGIMGKEESCCGGRSYEIGYLGEFIKYAEHTIQTYNSLGVRTVVTSCSDGYSFFKNLYPRVGIGMKFEVLHAVEYLETAIKDKRLQFRRDIPMKITYHDPCHIGRHLAVPLYDPPRNILKSIPGVQLFEMQRIRENAWCCGAGAGASQASPDFALWTANERLKEAADTGAEAIVTSCPWCERNFKDATEKYGGNLQVLDIAELVRRAL
jgi:Fe-S oxidoreductase